MTTLRYIFGVPIAVIGVIILLLHLYLFVCGVILRRRVSSALPVINSLILAVGFALLPISSGIALAMVLALSDLTLSTSVNTLVIHRSLRGHSIVIS